MGKIQFRAPKTAGCFVYRLFDKSSSDLVMETLATSVRFFNELYDGDVTLMLVRSYDGFMVSELQPAISIHHLGVLCRWRRWLLRTILPYFNLNQLLKG